MAVVDKTYRDLLKEILNEGFDYTDPNRKDVQRIQIPTFTFRHDFEDGFPAITTKKLFWKGVEGELLWFLRGEQNIRTLQEWGIKIWDKDVANYSDDGDTGRIYGIQWRDWRGVGPDDGRTLFVDQITQLVKTMINNPMSTSQIVTAWNPAELDQMCLPPCHWSFQILPTVKGFYLQWNQRSVDVFLGLPFNIASYGLLAKILEAITGRKALGIIGQLNNVHIYDNHLEAVGEQIGRDVYKYPACELSIGKTPHFFESHRDYVDGLIRRLNLGDFTLRGYESYPPIKAEMLAYNK